MINITGDSGYFEITTPKGKVKVEVKIMDGGIIFGFDSIETAKEVIEFEKKKRTKMKTIGNNGYIEIHRGKTREELRQMLKGRYEAAGGTWNESQG